MDRSSPARTIPPVEGLEKRRYVFDMFAALAPDYDRWNRLISLGLDQRWRRKATAHLATCRRVCDLGTGTGDMIRALLGQPAFQGEIIAVDPTLSLWLADSNADLRDRNDCRFTVAEGEHLPIADDTCDGIMSGFVMRNFFDLDQAMAEAARIVSPGGQGIFLEMGHPKSAWWRFIFRLYFQKLAPAIAGVFARNARAYRYLPASLARFPVQEEIRRRFLENGWRTAAYNEYLGGAIVAYRVAK